MQIKKTNYMQNNKITSHPPKLSLSIVLNASRHASKLKKDKSWGSGNKPDQ
jgi:hypothetical protein